MVYKCCVPMCKSGYVSNKEKVSIFQIPATKIDLYNQLIKLPDRKLTLKDHVCEKHFAEEFIRREDQWKTPLSRPRLTNDAIPTIFPSRSPIKISLKKNTTPKKKKPISNSALVTLTSLANPTFVFKLQQNLQAIDEASSSYDTDNQAAVINDNDDDGDDVQIIEPTSPDENVNTSAAIIEEVEENVNTSATTTKKIEDIVVNPSPAEDSSTFFRKLLFKKVVINFPRTSWSMCSVKKAGYRYITFSQTVLTNEDNTPVVKRKVVIERNLDYKLYIGFIPVTRLDKILPNISFKISTARDIEKLLLAFDNVDLCEGGPPIVKYPHAHIRDAELDLTTERWRSKHCELIVNGTFQCDPCLKFQKEALYSTIRRNCVSPKIRPHSLRRTRRKLRSQQLRLKKHCKELEQTVEKLQEKSDNLSNQMLITQLSKMNYSSHQRQLIEECIRMNEPSRCYSEDWLFTCTVLYKCNPEAYGFMWKSDLFPLPSPDTIKKSGSSLLGDKHSLKMSMSAQDEVDPLMY
ncbi:hypothetical protein ILUMI_10919 [Ignelater luminosus]|uniref:THAP-type domain-containing protein n=1 Tax=Ignelater luminosus TaxID=2038154 RepID=A0A8K0CWY4_IGNLU|nr:hypothetical protein ILUMI_10919 [Ignelater luminosus]